LPLPLILLVAAAPIAGQGDSSLCRIPVRRT